MRSRTDRLHYPIQRKIEDIVVVERSGFRPPSVLLIDRPRQQERDLLLAEAAMRSKPVPSQLTEIVILLPCANDGLAVAEDREIPFPVDRKFELLTHLLFVEN